MSARVSRTADSAVATFRRAWCFWLGILAITTGVALHLPMFLSARDDHYMLRGMGWSRLMAVGMVAIGVGLVLVFRGIAPQLARPRSMPMSHLRVRALEDSRIGPAHLRLTLVLLLAIAIDTQKPFTFTFVLPGVAADYGLKSPTHPVGDVPVALLPLSGIVGTVLGSFLWGFLGDRIGRRAAILLSGVSFIATAACGAMPAFHWNLVMCFLMGIGVGGLLPIAYSLLTEMIPARHRGGAVVLVAGVGTAAGFLLTSWLAHWLIPIFGWRIMWFVGLPTGLALLALSNEIPESPRFLLATGRAGEAEAVMRRFGVAVSPAPPADRLPDERVPLDPGIFARPFARISTGVALYGLAWGLVNFGFLVWLPIDLADSGVSADTVTTVLAKSALFSLPGSLVVAWLYRRWSAKGTVAVAGLLTAAALAVFAVAGADVARHTAAFTALVVLLLVSMWAVVSVLAPYSAEIYPTAKRASGAGLAAGATKVGGVLALAMAVLDVSPPSLRGAALLAAVPTILAALVLIFVGVETRGRRLDEVVKPLAVGDTS